MAASGVRRGSKGSHLAIGSVDFTVCGEDDPADSSNRPGAAGAALRGRRNILFSHVLKNSAAPILTCISIYVGLAFGGSTVIEGIFSVDGLGRMVVSAVARLDIYVIQGFVLWVALIYLGVNFLVDILSAVIDPRIKYNQETGGKS